MPRRPVKIAPPLKLAPPFKSEATIRECERLVKLAKRGELVGIAFVGISPNDYFFDVVGEADARPTVTRGMILALDDLLAERIRQRRLP